MNFLNSSDSCSLWMKIVLNVIPGHLGVLTLLIRSLLSLPSRFLMLLAMSLGALMDHFLQRLHKQAKTSKHYISFLLDLNHYLVYMNDFYHPPGTRRELILKLNAAMSIR